MSDFPSTEELLVAGSDPRLKLDPATGVNHYLCRPYPEPNLLRFGASTATTIDARGWEVAERFRDRLAHDPLPTIHQHLCDQLRDLCKLDDSTAITLTESGTSAHRLAAERARQQSPAPLHIMVMQPSETGSGVPDALTLGGTLPLLPIALRDDNGAVRPPAEVDDAVTQQVAAVMKRGASLLLVMVDGSKSGLAAPSPAAALALRDRFPDRIQLLMDGCQFRFDGTMLRHYLRQHIMVAVTGSKFLAGPSFSGALLCPAPSSFRRRPESTDLLPPSFRRRPESTDLLPSSFRRRPESTDTLPPSFRRRPESTAPATAMGLLLRWQVALANLRALSQQDGTQADGFIADFSQHLRQRLNQDPMLQPLPTAPHSTIFPFTLREQPTMNEALTLYQQLHRHGSPRVQLGRPMQLGVRADGRPVAALRLSLSAPLIVDAVANNHQHSLINQAMTALDRVVEVAKGTLH